MTTAIVLLSGGQDSTTCLYWAKGGFDRVIAASCDYGQRHRAELVAAAEIAKLAAVEHITFEMPILKALGGSDLVTENTEIKGAGGHSDTAAPDGLPTSFVPGRNAFLLTAAAAIAVKHGAKDIVGGMCQTDYSGYPDCREEFIDALQTALTKAMPSSCGPIAIHTPLMNMTKAETVKLMTEMPGAVDAVARSITCYEGKRPGCGVCPSCALRIKGFLEAGVTDPATL